VVASSKFIKHGRSPLRNPRLFLLLATLVFICLGLYFLQGTKAAGTPSAFEAESGTVSAPASKISDANASGGSAVKFVDPTAVKPFGNIPGTWNTLTFDDEFNGTAVDTSKWIVTEGDSTNNVTTHARNATVSGGNLILTLESTSSGAELDSSPYLLPVGSYAEARVYFPGNGTTIYNWPAWWTSGPNWPAGGEWDICEGLGTMTSSYHSTKTDVNLGTIPGTWSNSYHVYGLHRLADRGDIYYDGVLVKSYPSSDNGAAQYLIVNIGNGFGPTVTGTASQMKVDYVRAWAP
jgi:hypothetical protein